ncbi:MAG: YdeI/OmpD-associated family protein [Chloroflexota bacterium]
MPQYRNPGKLTFTGVINGAEDNGGAFIEFPHDVQEMFGVKGRVPVKVIFDGHRYRGSMVRMGSERHLILMLKEIREKLGKGPGDSVAVTVELDVEERKIILPPDAREALRDAGVLQAFDKLAFSYQREHVMSIEDAKRPETRQSRIEKMVTVLREKATAR